MWWKLQCHEEGHNESSGHIVGDPIMNPSIVNTRTENRINRSSGYGKFLVREYGGEAVGHPDPGPDPEPPKDPIQKQLDDLSRELNANRIKDVIQGVHLELLQNRVAELEAKHEK